MIDFDWLDETRKQHISLCDPTMESVFRMVCRKAGKPLVQWQIGGYDIDLDAFEKAAISAGAVLAGSKITPSMETRYYYHPDWGYAWARKDVDGGAAVYAGQGEGRDLVDAVRLFAKSLRDVPKTGAISVLVRNQAGYDLATAGNVGLALERSNYPPDVLERYDHAISCLRSKRPCGRLVLLDGPPGTGKSYLIRSLPPAADGLYVLVAPSLVGNLSGPELVPVLLGNHNRDRPIVLIIEDADDALVKRELGDRAKLSEILNIGDGLLGQMMDLRIIATTNAGRRDLDPAVTRPGRLCSHVHTPDLGHDHANSIRKRLLDGGSEHPRGYGRTLADVYRAAREDGWKPDKADCYRPGDYR